MGTQETKADRRYLRMDKTLYSFDHKTEHCLFGRLSHYRCNESKHWVSGTTLDFRTIDEASKALSRLANSIAHPVPGLLAIRHAQHSGSDGGCSHTTHNLEVFFDKTDENLEGRVAAAIEKRVPLAEALSKE
jgi:hypothetical protein